MHYAPDLLLTVSLILEALLTFGGCSRAMIARGKGKNSGFKGVKSASAERSKRDAVAGGGAATAVTAPVKRLQLVPSQLIVLRATAQRQIAKHIDARLGKKSATLGNLPGPFEPLTMERIVNELWRKATEASKTPSGERQIKLGKEKFAETVKSFVQNWWNNDQVVRGMKKAAREEYAGKLASVKAACTGAIAGTVRL